MVDATAVRADLTPAQQEETMTDLSFFLDEYGSTRTVRVMLEEQESDITRLEGQVRRLLSGRKGTLPDPKDRTNEREITKNSEIEDEIVDETMADLDFFLKNYGSTRAVREKLQSQRREIMGLHRTIQWFGERQKTAVNSEDSSEVQYVGTECASAPTLKTTKWQTERSARAQRVDRSESHTSEQGDNCDDRVGVGDVTMEGGADDGIVTTCHQYRNENQDDNRTGAPFHVEKVGVVRASSSEMGPDSLEQQLTEEYGNHQTGHSTNVTEIDCNTAPRDCKACVGSKSSRVGGTPLPKDDSPGDCISSHAKPIPVCTLSSKAKNHCRHLDCKKLAQAYGLCCRHGGYRMCKVDGCDRKAATRYLCRSHGGGTICKISGCEKLGQGQCLNHAREHGITVGKRCLNSECEKLAVHSGGGYCCSHARDQGIFVKSGKKCCVGACEKLAAAGGKGYCCRHAREHGIEVKSGRKCRVSDCVKIAVYTGEGYCCRHAREQGIVVKTGKKCCVSDCDRFAVSTGGGYCHRHAREHGIVLKPGKKCCIRDCLKLAIFSGKGYCCSHARERGIEVKSGKKCCVSECERFAVSGGKGHCWRHARAQGIELKGRCKFIGCSKVQVNNGYCHDHQRDDTIAETEHGVLDKQSWNQAQSMEHGDSVANDSGHPNEVDSCGSSVKHRGPHVVCKELGCLKWVMRNGDLNEYCTKHRGGIERNTSFNEEDTVETSVQKNPYKTGFVCKEPGCSRMGIGSGLKKGYCFRHGGGYRCTVEGCNKARQRNRLCSAHGGYYDCKVEGCKKRNAVRGYCVKHYRERSTLKCIPDSEEPIRITSNTCSTAWN